MTRPMPGPPEWHYIDFNPIWGMVWIKNGDECDETFSHAELDKKRLTDAECAAEYWRAFCDHARPLAANMFVPAPEWDRACQEVGTWRRFKDTPHALEEA